MVMEKFVRNQVKKMLKEYFDNADVQKVLKILKSNSGYEILDNSVANGTDYQSGACWIMADALSIYYNLPVYVVFNNKENRVEHFVVRAGSQYLDSDGYQSKQELINKTKDDGFYKHNNFDVVEYKEGMNTSNIIRDISTSKKLVALLQLRTKTIKEDSSKHIVQEDYESVSEIKTLANDILVAYAKKNIKWVIDKAQKDVENEIKGELVSYYFEHVQISEATKDSQGKYKKLEKFVNANLTIRISYNKKAKYDRASYISGENVGHILEHPKRIILNFDDNFVERIKTIINDYNKLKIPFNYINLYSAMYYSFHSSLVHELQHAYDDYRSGGKIFKTKDNMAFEKEKVALEKEVADDVWTNNSPLLKQYFNLSHEYWARFSQAIDKTRFVSSDFGTTDDGRSFFKTEMSSIKDVVGDFRSNFEHWNALSDGSGKFSKVQVRLIKAVVVFWHKTKDVLEKKGKVEYF